MIGGQYHDVCASKIEALSSIAQSVLDDIKSLPLSEFGMKQGQKYVVS
jgi:hypothetical protein